MRKTIIIILLLISAIPLFGEGNSLNVDLKGPESQQYSLNPFLQFGINYRIPSFLNQEFQGAMAEGIATRGTSFEGFVDLRLIKRFHVEVSAFYDKFSKTEIDGTNSVVRQKGYGAMLNWYVLPSVGKVSKIISPYVGAGYQRSDVNMGDGFNTSSPMWQAGLKIHFSSLFINGAFKQSIPVKSNVVKQQAFVIGAGFSL